MPGVPRRLLAFCPKRRQALTDGFSEVGIFAAAGDPDVNRLIVAICLHDVVSTGIKQSFKYKYDDANVAGIKG